VTASFVSAGAFTNSAGATSSSPALPAGYTGSALLIAYVVTANAKTIAVSAGWTKGQAEPSGATLQKSCWAWRVADGSETACVFSWTSNTACVSGCNAYTGAPATSPIAGSATPADGTSNPNVGTYTTTVANALLVEIALSQAANVTITEANTGWSAADSSFKAASRQSVYTFHDIVSTSGTVVSFGTGDGTGSQKIDFVVELKADLVTETSTIDMTFAAMTQAATVAEAEPSTIGMTLANTLLQEIDASNDGLNVTIATTLANISQEIDATEVVTGTVDQTFPVMQEEIDVADSPDASIGMTLSGALQELLITTEIVIESIDQTLPGALQELLAATEVEITSVNTVLFSLSDQELDGSVSGPARITQILPGVLQEVFAATEIEITALDQVLPGLIVLDFEADQSPPVVIRSNIPFALSMDVEAIIADDAQIDMTFVSISAPPVGMHVDMTLGGSISCASGVSRSGWWAGE
jgi:hypothetical protein